MSATSVTLSNRMLESIAPALLDQIRAIVNKDGSVKEGEKAALITAMSKDSETIKILADSLKNTLERYTATTTRQLAAGVSRSMTRADRSTATHVTGFISSLGDAGDVSRLSEIPADALAAACQEHTLAFVLDAQAATDAYIAAAKPLFDTIDAITSVSKSAALLEDGGGGGGGSGY
jgi:hypothetical protein